VNSSAVRLVNTLANTADGADSSHPPVILKEIQMDLSLLTYLILVGIAFFAGLISSVAGSGGLLTLPALLWVGLPPLTAVGTYKIQSSVGALSSTWNFFRSGHLEIKTLVMPVIMAMIGSILGTLTVQTLDGAILRKLIPFLLLGIAIFFLLSPKVKDTDSRPLITINLFAGTAALGVGFYGGFFGPGIGSIMPFLFVWLLGYNLVKATADTKLMSLAINGISAVLFTINGLVLWEIAVPMAVGQIIGARLGSNLVMSQGTSLVQPIITVVTLVVALKLVFFP
jgi:uncharacterized membrane protein YfcA